MAGEAAEHLDRVRAGLVSQGVEAPEQPSREVVLADARGPHGAWFATRRGVPSAPPSPRRTRGAPAFDLMSRRDGIDQEFEEFGRIVVGAIKVGVLGAWGSFDHGVRFISIRGFMTQGGLRQRPGGGPARRGPPRGEPGGSRGRVASRPKAAEGRGHAGRWPTRNGH